MNPLLMDIKTEHEKTDDLMNSTEIYFYGRLEYLWLINYMYSQTSLNGQLRGLSKSGHFKVVKWTEK